MIIKRQARMGKNILLNINSAKPIKYNDLQTVFLDPECDKCIRCMERAIRAHKIRDSGMKSHISVEDFEGLVKLDGNSRKKRKVSSTDVPKKNKKSKPKKNKSATVLKYFQDEKIYALKIKESNVFADQQNISKTDTTCQVYSVINVVPCQTPEANAILALTKKHKKEQNKKKTGITRLETTQVTPTLKKREIDDSQIAEHYMPSIEDLY